MPGPFAFGAVCEGEVEVELEVELELELLEELDDDEEEDADEEEEVVEVVGGGVVVVVAVGVHDSDSCATGPVIGNWIEDSGVPAGTFTLKVNV